MPHLQLDHSTTISIKPLLELLTEEFCQIKTIDPASVKSYSRTAEHFNPGNGAPNQFIHLTACLLEGRNPETLKEISHRLYALGSEYIERYADSPVSWTLEIREMNHPTYRKSTVG
jgi:5-carboxymethyl-2-hydroxymuconate isomerase